MLNSTSKTYILKREILSFSNKISRQQSKPVKKFTADMTYGILASGSCLLTDIVAQLHENAKKINSVERPTRRLDKGISLPCEGGYLLYSGGNDGYSCRRRNLCYAEGNTGKSAGFQIHSIAKGYGAVLIGTAPYPLHYYFLIWRRLKGSFIFILFMILPFLLCGCGKTNYQDYVNKIWVIAEDGQSLDTTNPTQPLYGPLHLPHKMRSAQTPCGARAIMKKFIYVCND